MRVHRSLARIDVAFLDLALWGHIHKDDGDLLNPPYDLSTNNVCDANRSYRLVRVQNGTVLPSATLSAGAGFHLEAKYTPENNGQHDEVTAEVVNMLNERFEHGLLRFHMPKGASSFQVTGGTLIQVDPSGPTDVYHVGVDILPGTSHEVTVTVQ